MISDSLAHFQIQLAKELSAESFSGSPSTLYIPIQEAMALPGKRLRPAILLLVHQLYGGDVSQAMPAAKALEVFHNFTLVHDDIMDNALLRRGKPSVYATYGANTAILAGDVMLVLAFQNLLLLDAQHWAEAIKLFNETAIKVCEGQQLDLDYENREDLTLEQYEYMVGLKTATLLAACFRMGGLLAGASPADQELLYSIGYELGTAFQIQDDYLDAFGDAAQVGKTKGGDIIAGKTTGLFLKACASTAQEEERKQWMALYHRPISEQPDKVELILAWFEGQNIPQWSREHRDQFYNQALEHIAALNVEQPAKEQLIALAKVIVFREA